MQKRRGNRKKERDLGVPGARGQILESALIGFLLKGVTATTIADIRRDSGASVGSIYHYFDGKEGIADSLLMLAAARHQEGFLATLRGARNAHAGIEAGVHFHLRWTVENRLLARFAALHGEADLLALRQHGLEFARASFAQQVGDWLKRERSRGQIRMLPKELYRPLWLGPVQEFARAWAADRYDFPATNAILQARLRLPREAWRALRPRPRVRR